MDIIWIIVFVLLNVVLIGTSIVNVLMKRWLEAAWKREESYSKMLDEANKTIIELSRELAKKN